MQQFNVKSPDGRQWVPPPDPPGRLRRFLLVVLAVVVSIVVVAVVLGLLSGESPNGKISPSGGTTPGSTPLSTAPTTATSAAPSVTAAGEKPISTSCATQQGLITRDCAIFTPPGLPEGVKLPVVLLLHGMGDGPSIVRSSGNWGAAVVEDQFMLVTPSGVAASWNAGDCCGISKATEIDDVGYLMTLMKEIRLRPDVDPDRIFVAGFSNGGMMTYRLLCDGGDVFSGAAVVSGARVADCAPSRPTSLLHIHGTTDETVPYSGADNLVSLVLGVSFPSAFDSVKGYAETMGCSLDPVEVSEGTVTTREWTGCADDRKVEFVTIQPWPHQWPLTGPLNGTQKVLEFFGIA